MEDFQRFIKHPRDLYFSYADAARKGQLVFVKCQYCRRGTYFLASDLVLIIEPKLPIYAPPFPCSKCGSQEFIRTDTRTPKDTDYGKLDVRRPAELKQIQMWKTVKLGE